jgi:hypothetical protein
MRGILRDGLATTQTTVAVVVSLLRNENGGGSLILKKGRDFSQAFDKTQATQQYLPTQGGSTYPTIPTYLELKVFHVSLQLKLQQGEK